jgi:hypothetical protein
MADRPYLFLELTNSICSICLRKVEAKVVSQDERVYLLKHCPEHGAQKVLISSDESYYRVCRGTMKAGQLPLRFNTPFKYGCPYDCGLCPDHEQHSCLALIEVTDHCNLTCPICYSESSPKRPVHRSLEQIAFMLDSLVKNEGRPDIVQISGGEPTIHPQFFEILSLARSRPIKHLMVNTNGIRIAQDPDFARRLAEFMPGFEIYLQFDSLDDRVTRQLRGEDLSSVRLRALERLNALKISTTLVVTLKRGLNDGEIGRTIDFALSQPCVRGVTFQPVQIAGRLDGFDPAVDRLTLADVRRGIHEQSSIFAAEDIIPVPCHPDCLAMAYALKINSKVIPLTRIAGQSFLSGLGAGNTIVYEHEPAVREHFQKLFSASNSPESAAGSLKQLLCCLPEFRAPNGIGYQNIFRVLIVQFLDPYNFDVRSVKKSCIHIVHPDGRIIPFDTYNLFYRDGKEQRLKELQAVYEAQAAGNT